MLIVRANYYKKSKNPYLVAALPLFGELLTRKVRISQVQAVFGERLKVSVLRKYRVRQTGDPHLLVVSRERELIS